MLNASEEALGYMKELLNQEANTGSAIRVAVMGNSGLGLVVDDPQENDVIFNKEQFSIIVDRNLIEFCKTITIGFKTGDSTSCSSSGYIIETENAL
ncbi:hypothetical protein [Desulfopila sp. IMCC35008]|uniref:hypothetical protein n=1 Tax=Desulfopila sp. IMCC35008 TaxID=2653858 RepID=UPI0013D691FF|nr:hypothetical protein [Desulfopila sp. IMCC35008]